MGSYLDGGGFADLQHFVSNQPFFFHFSVLQSPLSLLTSLPLLFLLWWVLGHMHRPKWPRFGMLAVTFGNLGFAFIVFVIAWAWIVTTPFVIIDYQLAAWDQFFGFNVVDFMNWVNQHPRILNWLSFGYFSWEYQVVLTPLLLALLNKRKEINQYFIASAICF